MNPLLHSRTNKNGMAAAHTERREARTPARSRSPNPPVELKVAAPFAGTAKQWDVGYHFHDPAVRVVLAGGAIRSGKTQAAGVVLVETALNPEHVGTYLVARLTYRELKDSTQKAMLYGDGALPPLIPPAAIDQYRASDEIVRLVNGSEIGRASCRERVSECV